MSPKWEDHFQLNSSTDSQMFEFPILNSLVYTYLLADG